MQLAKEGIYISITDGNRIFYYNLGDLVLSFTSAPNPAIRFIEKHRDETLHRAMYDDVTGIVSTDVEDFADQWMAWNQVSTSSITTDGLVFWGKFLASETTANRSLDYSPVGINRVNLFSGKGLSQDGTNDDITFNEITMPGDFTVSMWIKTADTDYVLSETGGINHAILFESNRCQIRISGTFYTIGALNYTDNVISLVTFTRSGSTVTLRRNKTIDASITASISDFNIGGTRQSSSATYYGLTIHNRALSSTEIDALYDSPELKPPADDLQLWLPMNEGAGFTVYDGSVNQNHATIAGATWVISQPDPCSQTVLISWNKYKVLRDITTSDATLTTPLNPVGSFCLEFIYSDDNTGAQVLMAKHDGSGSYIRYLATGNDIYIFLAGNTNNLSFDFTTTRTAFNSKLKITYDLDTTTFKVYSNDVLGSTQVIDFGGFNTKLSGFGKYNSGTRSVSNLINIRTRYWEDSTQTTLIGEWNGIDYQDKIGTNHCTINGTPTMVLVPEGLISGKDLFGVNDILYPRLEGTYNFDGNSYAAIAQHSSLSFTTAVSGSFVYDNRGQTSSNGFIGNWTSDHSFLIYQNGTSTMRLIVANLSTTEDTLTLAGITIGKHHVYWLFDNGYMAIYIDNVLAASKTSIIVLALYQSTTLHEIGRWGANTSKQITTQISEPVYHNKALTVLERESDYNYYKAKYGL